MKKIFLSMMAMILLLAGCSLESPLEKQDSGKSDKDRKSVV